jgi:hypothetical protein
VGPEKKCINENRYNFYSPPKVTGTTKLKRMRWVRLVASMGKRVTHISSLVGENLNKINHVEYAAVEERII